MPLRVSSVLALGLLVTSHGVGQRFEDVSAAAGIDFVHAASKSPQKYLVEAMGSGVALLDFDDDGLLDIYCINGADLAAEGGPSKTDPRYWNRLYRNLGEWRFEDVTEQSRVAGRGFGMGVAAADYDNDGDTDIFVTNLGPDILYRNDGDGIFQDVSHEAGIEGVGWSSGAAFVDYDADGLLDLFVAKYLDWDLGNNRPCGSFLPERRSYCHPRLFGPAAYRLYRNLGEGRFVDVSVDTGIAAHPGKGLGVALGDFDADGWVDIFVANDSYPQQLFRNLEGKGFEDVGVLAGVAYDAEGQTYAGMGVAWEDVDGGGHSGILVNALGRQGYWLYRDAGDDFEAVSNMTGIAALSGLRSGWGMGLADFDNDGWRDLFVAQGHVMDDIAASDPALSDREPFLIARNLFGRFFDVAGRAGEVFERRFAGRGAAFGDLDWDGLIDIVVNVNDGPAVLLKNTTQNAGSYLTVRLEGSRSARDAIGAKVTVRTSADSQQAALVGSAGSYLSSGPHDLHFGLGQTQAAEVIVRWPDGRVQSVAEPTGPLLLIRETSIRQ